MELEDQSLIKCEYKYKLFHDHLMSIPQMRLLDRRGIFNQNPNYTLSIFVDLNNKIDDIEHYHDLISGRLRYVKCFNK